MRYSLLVLTLLSSVVWADADLDGGIAPPSQLRVATVPSTVKLGEPFVVEVAITHLSAQRYELKTPSDLQDFDYLGQERQRLDGPTESTTVIKVKLAAFALGKQRTPRLTLEVSEPGIATELETAGSDVDVVSSLPPDAETKGANLYDVRSPEELPIRTWRVLYALAGLLAAALVGWLLYRRLSRPRSEVLVEPPKEALHVRTGKALDELAKRNLPAQRDFKTFYFRLSEILRGYLGELYGFEALESTTPELLEAVRARHTPGLALDELSAFANASDFIRYARTEPSADECKQHLEFAYRVVHETTTAMASLLRAREAAKSLEKPATSTQGGSRAPQ